MEKKGKLVDIHLRRIINAAIIIENGIIVDISERQEEFEDYILPGLVDSHVHIESSMVTPGSFASAAVSRGTIGVVCDPHEIANVLGIEGVRYMIKDASTVPMKFWFGAPSCVPATDFETNGGTLDACQIGELLSSGEAKYLAEMMNYPGVIFKDPSVIEKIKIARTLNKKIDGHAPGLTGADLKSYINAGISTDHECSAIREAIEKIKLGMHILIREGSAARNLEALKDLLKICPEKVMLCSDDIHPEMLSNRHINYLVSTLVSHGYDLFDVLRSCTLNPAIHYGINTGLLRIGDPADFIVLSDLKNMEVAETWIDGTKVFDGGKTLFNYTGSNNVNNFNASFVKEKDLEIVAQTSEMRIIAAHDGELLTEELRIAVKKNSVINPDINSDILKIVVKDRYLDSPPAVGFIKGFGLSKGAFASSVAHDSHNIICIGTNDKDISTAINRVVSMRGGLAVAEGSNEWKLPLPVAGLMSDKPVNEIASQYQKLSDIVKSFGCKMSAPFMTLSFMALLVIPAVKMSDRGLFDGQNFCFVPLFPE